MSPLYHYSSAPIDGPIVSSDEQIEHWMMRGKPTGFWVSCCEDVDANGGTCGWWDWCTLEEWRLESLVFRHTVTLTADARILRITSSDEIRDLAKKYPFQRRLSGKDQLFPNWRAIATEYQGVIISPYQWDCRYDVDWYYGWDCASGCIWDADAIESVVCDVSEDLRQRLFA